MTTPYGTTTFTYGQNGTYRYLTATDPLGQTERLEWHQPAPPNVLSFSEPTTLIPKGIVNPFNEYMTGRDTFYWDKHAYAVAAGDYSKARIRHWMHLNVNNNEMYHQLESIKYPFENRIWYNYPNQSSTGFSGSLDSPTRIGRVLDDGTSQLSQMTYNNMGHPTDMIDPAGRETQLTYDTNGIDLLTMAQKTAVSFSTIAQFSYNAQHLPLTYTDAAGQMTRFQYNAAGQLLQMTDALGETTSYQYDGLGYLTSIINANNETQTSFVYDTYGRVSTATDSEGYAVSYSYDAADRVTQETFPDATTRKYVWTTLDLTSVIDRQGNTTKYAYDAIRDLLSTTNPLNHVTKLGYWENQTLKTLTDPNGNTTTWNIDIQNRLTGKQYADGTQVTNTYENTTSRLHAITDALGQVKTFAYGNDDTLSGITYANTLNATPNVLFTYDPSFRRITSMTDGTGTRLYFYQPVGAMGALQLAFEANAYSNNSSIAYQYDALSRLSARTVDTSTETFAYDKLSRLITHSTDMGTFNLSYLGQTGQLSSQHISTGTVSTSWAYDSNTNDRRLKTIANSGASRSYNFTTTPENLITQIQETAPNGSAFAPQTWNYSYDNSYRLTNAAAGTQIYGYGLDPTDNITTYQSPTGTTTASYNNLNQLTEFGGQPYAYDANGNLLSDGTRAYRWDAENRLIQVTNAATPFFSTRFTYDGISRRVTISSHDNRRLHSIGPEGVSQARTATNLLPTAETRYLWCGETLCQARDSNDTVIHRYYPEGELLPLSNTSMYYAQDQVDNVRDVLSAKGGDRVASINYNPYGEATQSSGTVPVDLRYAGLFYDQQSGLYLAHHRIYEPKTGRWISRDPIGVNGGLNLFSYLSGEPIAHTDTSGYSWYSSVVDSVVDRLPLSFVNTLAGGQQFLNLYQGAVEGFDPTPLSAWIYSYFGLQANRCSEAFKAGHELGERTALIQGLILGLGELKAGYLAIQAESRINLLVFKNGRWYGGQRGAVAAATVERWTEELNDAIGGLFLHEAEGIAEFDKEIANPSSCGCGR
jgi:RHS repeat-associated protein